MRRILVSISHFSRDAGGVFAHRAAYGTSVSIKQINFSAGILLRSADILLEGLRSLPVIDLDGGFGKEQSPSDLDTIADLGKMADLLSRRGYSSSDVEKIMWKNFVEFFRNALK